MTRRYSGRKRFILMPAHGLASDAMKAHVLKAKTTRALSDSLRVRIAAVAAPLEAPPPAQNAPTAQSALAENAGDADFEVLSQRFEDGPATVSMSQAARMMLEASHPELRVLPVTAYHLTGRRPRRGATVASQPAGTTATAADGSVFLTDLKQHVLTGVDPGAKGQGVLVGVIDTGIDATHPALAGQVTISRCLITGADATAGRPVDWGASNTASSGHGTHVAGIIAAAAGFPGPAGVAPAARLASYRIFPDDPTGLTTAENAVIIDSIRAAIMDGCHIVNLSIEGTPKEDGVRTAIEDAWNNGMLCVAAAGNNYGNPVSYPAALQHCVAVTAIGRDGCFPDTPGFKQHVSSQRASSDPAIFLASFSNYGPQVQFTAPGHAIVSTFPGGAWWFDSGTSMSAPFVSGVLARLLSDNTNILGMAGTADRSAAMLQMLVGRAHVLGLPQAVMEGYGLAR